MLRGLSVEGVDVRVRFTPATGAGLARRDILRGAAASAGVAMAGSAASASASVEDPFDGKALAADVLTYDGFGIHRTGTDADIRTGDWLAQAFSNAGLRVRRQAFDVPIFSTERCAVELSGREVEAWPAWPVHPTSAGGVSGPLCDGGGPVRQGGIALVRLAYGPGGAWASRGAAERVLEAFRGGAAGVVAVTEGPTGAVVEMNAMTEPFAWPGPVVLVAGRDGALLSAGAAKGGVATLVCAGTTDGGGAARNIVGSRAGVGKTIAVSTPMSGWFHCAGERGSGIAVFLALVRHLTRSTSRPLFFTANSGHELSNLGARTLMKTLAPPPSEVGPWLHIGANVAINRIRLVDGVANADPAPEPARGLQVTGDLLDAARAAFAGQPGYETPALLSQTVGLGETKVYWEAGYASLIGVVGENPLFHTPLDRAPLVTSPGVLEPVARALGRLLDGQQA